jgi:hypothetical protein
MNLFEFMDKVIMFASLNVGNFFVALLFIILFGLFIVSMFNVIFSNFRLFEYNSKKSKDSSIPEIKFDLNNDKKTDQNINTNNIYDLLIKAWEKHKKNKDS